MSLKKLFFLLNFLLIPFFLFGQEIGGSQAFSFLRLSQHAMTTSLGGTAINALAAKPSLIRQNPALLSEGMVKKIDFSFLSLFAGTSFSEVATVIKHKKIKMPIGINFQFMNYGSFDRTNASAQTIGSFNAQEFSVGIGSAMKLSKQINLGYNLRFIHSNLASYKASGIAADVGLTYTTKKNSQFALVLRDAGSTLSYYENIESRPLPIAIHFAYSKTLKHLPFRWTLTYRDANRWNTRYDDPNFNIIENIFSNSNTNESSSFEDFVDTFFRHILFSGELFLGAKKNFNIRFAYDYQQSRELKSEELRSLAGLNWGLGFKIKSWVIDFGKSYYSVSRSSNHISLQLTL